MSRAPWRVTQKLDRSCIVTGAQQKGRLENSSVVAGQCCAEESAECLHTQALYTDVGWLVRFRCAFLVFHAFAALWWCFGRQCWGDVLHGRRGCCAVVQVPRVEDIMKFLGGVQYIGGTCTGPLRQRGCGDASSFARKERSALFGRQKSTGK